MDYRGARFYDADVGRFLSLDPLAAKYPSLSDYCYVAGNPLVFVDPDGKHIEPIVTKGGGKDGRDLMTIRITGKLINFSDNDVNMDRALDDIKSMVESSFQGENIEGVDIKVNFDFTVVEKMDEVDESDHLIVLAEARSSKTPGVANGFGGKVAAVDADYFTGVYDVNIGEEGERTAAHEVGHLFGLSHGSGKGKRNNLMTQGAAMKRGNEITKEQLSSVKRNVSTKGQINLGSNTHGAIPNLGIGYKVMYLANTAGRLKTNY